ncbi:hypothetical protein H920_05633 [Fukomys damarensis]|uniref:Uncharacterized protein n=1 Tax=Fukomys damarensis TaxID=885580 RepID=A0A091DPK7_FUKDA|nr:hypothetical protein H920_05633 [Fukomys damarensis]
MSVSVSLSRAQGVLVTAERRLCCPPQAVAESSLPEEDRALGEAGVWTLVEERAMSTRGRDSSKRPRESEEDTPTASVSTRGSAEDTGEAAAWRDQEEPSSPGLPGRSSETPASTPWTGDTL